MPVSDVRELALLLKTRTPLLMIDDEHGARALELLRSSAEKRAIFVWNAALGLRRDGEPAPVYGTTKLDGCLDHIAASGAREAVYALTRATDLFDDRERTAKLLALTESVAAVGASVVLIGNEASAPESVRRLARCVRLSPPTEHELYGLVNTVLAELRARMPVRMELDEAGARTLINALSGLTLAEARDVIARAIVDDGRLGTDDLAFVIREKRARVERSGVLEFCDSEAALESVAGLARLKRWLAARAPVFADSERARAFGLPAPRGVLLLGVQGCGKSACAKAIAHAFGAPLVRLDPSRIYDKFLGESEKNFQRALTLAAQLQPVVFWIDELEKVMGGSGGEDNGVSQRMLGAFLTWLQERRSGVFVVATANDVTRLPAELLRKGRFDEIFFVDLPKRAVRAEILEQKLRERARDPSAFALDELADVSEGFSGAELEQAVASALYSAFAEDSQLTQAHLHEALVNTRPLSVLMAEPISALRSWAASRTLSADD